MRSSTLTNRVCSKCGGRSIIISIRSFMGGTEIVDASCLICGKIDDGIEGRVYLVEGNQFIEIRESSINAALGTAL